VARGKSSFTRGCREKKERQSFSFDILLKIIARGTQSGGADEEKWAACEWRRNREEVRTRPLLDLRKGMEHACAKPVVDSIILAWG